MSDYDYTQDTQSPPPGILVSGHFREPFGYQVNRSMGTKDWLITYTLSGEGSFRIGESVQTCTSNDIVILSPGTSHHYATSPNQTWEFMWAHFIPRPQWMHWFHLPGINRGISYIQAGELTIQSRCINAFQRMLNDSRGVGAFHEELALNALEEVLLLVSQKLSEQTRPPLLDPRIEEVLQLLGEDISRTPSIDELARRVSLSPSRLSHLFKEQVGDSIMKTFLKIRLRQAARLLEFTTRQISEIAVDVGFQSPFYFSRQFTSYFGVSPSAYRERVQSHKG